MTKPKLGPVMESRHFVSHNNQNSKQDHTSFYNQTRRQAKQTPNPQKYANIKDWSKDEDGYNRKNSNLCKAERPSMYRYVAKLSKQVPAPSHYPQAGKGKDKFMLQRTDVGSYNQ